MLVGKVFPKGARAAVAGKIYEKVLKPAKKYSDFDRARMVAQGLEEGIPITRKGADKIGKALEKINDEIDVRIKGAGDARTIDPERVLARLDELDAQVADPLSSVNPFEERAAIKAARDNFRRTIEEARLEGGKLTAAEAQRMKRGTYQKLGDRAYRTEKPKAQIQAEQALARGLKEELEAIFPELKGLNAKDGALISLRDAIDDAVKRTGNRGWADLRALWAGGGVGAATQDPVLAAAATVMTNVVSSPGVSTKLAIALSRGSKAPMSASRARIESFARALGQASEDATANQGTDQE
jgi:hypothetical protein